MGKSGFMSPIFRRLAGLFAVFALSLLLSGCGSTVSSRIEKHPEAFTALSASDQYLVKTGRIREGMDRMTVFLAWGRAPEIYQGQRGGRLTEVWQYFQTRSAIVDYPMAYSPWGYYYDMGPTVITEQIPGKFAMFVNGRVVEWRAPVR
jgi:hypothetical protein